jgi:hypothetical protein
VAERGFWRAGGLKPVKACSILARRCGASRRHCSMSIVSVIFMGSLGWYSARFALYIPPLLAVTWLLS